MFLRPFRQHIALLLLLVISSLTAAQSTPVPMNVNAVRVIYGSGSQPPVSVRVQGTLADPCTRINQVNQSVSSTVIELQIEVAHNPDEICAQMLEPFDETYPIDIAGLQPGEYTVSVRGVTATLVLTQAMLQSRDSDVPVPLQCPTGDGVNTGSYYHPAANYCFVYPAQATISAMDHQVIIESGFALPDGNRGRLVITAEAADGRTLEVVAATLAEQNPDKDFAWTPVTIGGAPAQFTSTDGTALMALIIWQERLYTLELSPVDENLWGIVLASFTFPPPVPPVVSTTSGSGSALLPNVCPKPEEGILAYYSRGGAYCLVYPAEFIVSEVQENTVYITLPAGSMTEPQPPTLVITISPAFDASIDIVRQALTARYADLNPQFEEMTISGFPALISDDLPAIVRNRQVFILAANRVYVLTFMPVDEQFPEATAQTEALQAAVLSSFTLLFEPPQPEQVVSQPWFNTTHGYMLAYPSNFDRVEGGNGAVTFTGPREAELLADQKRFEIAVIPAAGRTPAAVQAELSELNPGITFEWAEMIVAGERLIYTDSLPGAQTSRQGYLIHDEKLFVFSMIPLDEELWQSFITSFQFVQAEYDPAMPGFVWLKLDNPGVDVMMPETWRLRQFGSTRTLTPSDSGLPLVTLRRDDTVVFSSDIQAYAQAAAAQLAAYQPVYTISTAGKENYPAVFLTPQRGGLLCQVVYIAAAGYSPVINIGPAACDGAGRITDANVKLLLETLYVRPAE